MTFDKTEKGSGLTLDQAYNRSKLTLGLLILAGAVVFGAVGRWITQSNMAETNAVIQECVDIDGQWLNDTCFTKSK